MPNGLGLKRDLTKFTGLIEKKEKASALKQLELGADAISILEIFRKMLAE